MEDFRLKVFYTVGKNNSFTKAAQELFITQPAITKHIKLLEEELGLRLFDRRGSFISLTKAGEVLFKYASEIFQLYQEAIFDLGVLKNQFKGSLRIGASTTIAQYLLSPVLAAFYKKFDKVSLSLLNGNTEFIENALISKNIELGIVEGSKHKSGLRYFDFMEDELVVVTHCKSKYAERSNISIKEFTKMPLVLRERGSGTLEVIESKLKELGIKPSSLSVIMNLGSTESIKSFLKHSDALSFFSIRAIHHEVSLGEFVVLNIDDFIIKRKFSFVYLQGSQDSLSTVFTRFALRHYNL